MHPMLSLWQDITFTLTDANNGGRIDEDRKTCTLRLQANDNPHGSVEFAQEYFEVFERNSSDAQFVEVQRM